MKAMLPLITALLAVCLVLSGEGCAFVLQQLPARCTYPSCIARRHWAAAASSSSSPSEEGEETKGDVIRAATGIRPSLHPTTINAIAEALKLRAIGTEPLTVSDTVQPLDVALSAGKIAATAIEKRQVSSLKDGMALTPQEGQTVAGRVVGVVMRFEELERLLWNKVSSVGWVRKYGEWNTFGVLEDEEAIMMGLEDRIRDDPLFCLCRAECLLALFLHTVELPQLTKVGEAVPDSSVIDFLDSDRREALLNME